MLQSSSTVLNRGRARSLGEIASDCNALTRSSSRSASGSNSLCVVANTTRSCRSVSTSSTLWSNSSYGLSLHRWIQQIAALHIPIESIGRYGLLSRKFMHAVSSACCWRRADRLWWVGAAPPELATLVWRMIHYGYNSYRLSTILFSFYYHIKEPLALELSWLMPY